MANASNLEVTMSKWYSNVPHLPKNGQRWLADNMWWLALIGAILSVLGLIVIVPALFAAIAIGSFASTYSAAYEGAYSNSLGGMYWVSLVISIVSYIVTTVLLALSVNPLKVKAKRGWNLLFWSYLVNFGMAIISALVVMSISGVIGALIGAAIGGYFLFEIHSYFGARRVVEAKTVEKKV